MQTLVKLLKAIVITIALTMGVCSVIYLLQLLYSVGWLEEVMIGFIIGLIFFGVWETI